jgi:hypothetical protein
MSEHRAASVAGQTRYPAVQSTSLGLNRKRSPHCPQTDHNRSPGCQNYAKGGDLYDDELCPSCTSGVSEFGKGALMTGAITVLTAVLTKGKK